MAERIFTDWSDESTALWGRHPLMLKHSLPQHPLFSESALAELIDRYQRYPDRLYTLVHMGTGGKRYWREGELDNLTGAKVFDALKNGRLLLNLREAHRVDPRYGEVLDQIISEIGSKITDRGDFPSPGMSILISSPGSRTYYHFDLHDQMLWQISGRKRVYLYPLCEPFLRDEDLERVALHEQEVDMKYSEWFDKYATQVDLEPGQMMHWPLNMPHKVDNYDVLNISVTIEYWSSPCTRLHRVNMANGALREFLGVEPRSRATNGPAFLAKGILTRGLVRTPLLDKVRKRHRQIDFRLDREQPGSIVDVAPHPA